MTSQAHGVLGLADSKYDSQYIRYIHELVYRIVPFLEELISCPLVDLPSDQNDRTCPEASGTPLTKHSDPDRRFIPPCSQTAPTMPRVGPSAEKDGGDEELRTGTSNTADITLDALLDGEGVVRARGDRAMPPGTQQASRQQSRMSSQAVEDTLPDLPPPLIDPSQPNLQSNSQDSARTHSVRERKSGTLDRPRGLFCAR